MKAILTCCLWLGSIASLCGQVIFQQLQHNYGTLDLASGLVSQFVITNIGAKEVEIQKLDAGKEFTWTFSTTFLGPGDSDTLTLIFRPKKAGPVNEKITVYFEHGVKPIILEMRGDVRKTADQGYQIYYRNIDPMSLMPVAIPFHVFKVRQSEAGPPLTDAFVQILDAGEVMFSGYSDKDGVVKTLLNIGDYEIRATADGFKPLKFEQKIFKTAQEVEIVLDQIEGEPGPLASIQKTVIPSDSQVVFDTDTQAVDTGLMPIRNFSPNNIVLVIDVSTSMGTGPLMPLMKKTLKSLVQSMRPIDRIAIVTFAERAELILPSTPVQEKERILAIIENLHTEGLTYPNKCLEMGYATLTMNYVNDGANQMFLFTDGVINLRVRDEEVLANMKANAFRLNTSFTIIGLGKNDQAAPRLKEIAAKGGGDFRMVMKEHEIQDALLGSIMERSRKKN